jgi:hypothetical protein
MGLRSWLARYCPIWALAITNRERGQVISIQTGHEEDGDTSANQVILETSSQSDNMERSTVCSHPNRLHPVGRIPPVVYSRRKDGMAKPRRCCDGTLGLDGSQAPVPQTVSEGQGAILHLFTKATVSIPQRNDPAFGSDVRDRYHDLGALDNHRLPRPSTTSSEGFPFYLER